MKLISTFKSKLILLTLSTLLICTLATQQASAQICLDPVNTIYGLDNNANVHAITVSTGAVGPALNPAFTGNAPSSPNSLGYNPLNGKFYFFKRNPSSSPGEFVVFDPAFATITLLSPCPSSNTMHTGCVSYNGKGYYCIDVNAVMYYYDIASDTWTQITNKFFDNFGANITGVIQTHTTGDIAIDGFGNLWYICSGSSQYGLYKFSGPLPTTPVPSITGTQIISPTTPMPSSTGFQGAAFSATGDLFLSTGSGDNKLYKLTTTATLTLVSTLSLDGVGLDMTSCNFPFGVLPVIWQNFSADVQGNHSVLLKWTVAQEYDNKGYYAEHSLDGKNWEDIGFVAVAASNSNAHQYSFVHGNPVNGTHYYRIRQVDLDGNSTYSQITTINIKSGNQVAIWPNPAYDVVRIQQEISTGNGTFRAQLFDQSGRMISENTLHSGTNTVNINNLPSGTYIVRVQLANGETYNQKLLKK